MQIVIIVLIAVIIVYFVLIFPIFLKIKVEYLSDNKKCYFKLYLFNFIKILSGSISKIDGGLKINLGKNKIILFEFANALTVKNKVKPLMDYHIKNFYSLTEIGNINFYNPMVLGFIFQYLNGLICNIIKNKKNYINIKNDINIYEKEEFFNIFAEFTVILNLLMIVLSIIKIIMGKLINGISKRKQNKYGYGNHA